MVSADDIVDIVLQALKEEPPAPRNFRKILELEPKKQGKWGGFSRGDYNRPYTSLPAKKIFLSDYDIRKLFKPGDTVLKVPRAAIISPLAQEWLESRKIRIEPA